MLDVVLLGTGGSMLLPDRFLSSLLISYKGRKILIDCGEGTQVSMRMLKWGFKSIDLILITHEHGDHIFGLPGLLATIGNSGRTEPIYIIVPKGIMKTIDGLMNSVIYLPYDIYVIEVCESSIAVNFTQEGTIVKELDINNSIYEDLIISTLELDHSSYCIGYSINIPRRPKFDAIKASSYGIPKTLWKNLQNGEGVVHNGKLFEPNMVLGDSRKGIRLSYITDTRPIDTIPGFIKESDLFICEGTYGEETDFEKAIKNKHMTFSEAADLALKGNVKELLLTHFSPSMDNPEKYIENAIKIFSNTTIGYDRFTRTINFID